MSLLVAFDALAVAVVLFCFSRLLVSRRLALKLPPGPRGWPIIGNLLDMPHEREWITFVEWRDVYGDLITLKVFGATFIVINSVDAAVDILEKKSSVTSGRAITTMAELSGWGNVFALLPYGEKLRNYRRLARQLLGTPSTIEAFHPGLELEARHFLKRLLENPEHFRDHIHKAASSIILQMTYGYEVSEGDDPLVKLIEETMSPNSSVTANIPGAFLVNLIPCLRYIPEWFPGAGFQKTARQWASTFNESAERPLAFTKKQMELGTAVPSYVSKHLDAGQEDEFDIKWSAQSFYAAGSDTTVASVYAFFKAMTLYPGVQKKLKDEIESVVGNKLPRMEDQHELPYMKAVILEVYRWHTVFPTGISHQTTEDIMYGGVLHSERLHPQSQCLGNDTRSNYL